MSTREAITRELECLPDRDLESLLAFLKALREAHGEDALPALAAESALAKDWLAPEEDAAWANL
jgi:predicted ArsR family transcriptional regulator